MLKVYVRNHKRRVASAPTQGPRRDPLEPEAPPQWDFGTYKIHPLWTHDDEALQIRVGDKLYRGTSSKFTKGGIRGHVGAGIYERSRFGTQRRIYMSEDPEDAAGYGPITAEEVGGWPMLCEIEVTPELFAAMRPGYEGPGEWFVDAEAIPASTTQCYRLRVDRQTGNAVIPDDVMEKLREDESKPTTYDAEGYASDYGGFMPRRRRA